MPKFELTCVNLHAIAHMVGQTEQMFSRGITTREVADILGCSKPTAHHFLLKCEKLGVLFMTPVPYRKNANMNYWQLTGMAYIAYKEGVYRPEYFEFLHTKVSR